MTWASFVSRAGTMLFLLPVILRVFSEAEVALWYLLGSAAVIQRLAYEGFSSTYVRVISYCYVGAKEEHLRDNASHTGSTTDGSPNWPLIQACISNLNYVYIRVPLLMFSLIITALTLFVIKPIHATEQVTLNWVAWAVTIAGSIFSLLGSVFTTFLQGINQVALVQRWDAIFNLITILSNIVLVLVFESLLALVVSTQVWLAVSVIRNYYLSTKIAGHLNFLRVERHGVIQESTWQSSIRSIAGTVFGIGTTQFINFFYAQLANSSMLASYLLAYNLLDRVAQFSRAPFYSKVPLFASLRKKGDMERFKSYAQKNMTLTYWILVLGIVFLLLFGRLGLELIGSNSQLPNNLLLATMGFAFLIERFPAMHIQLYSTTNHIVWHIANGIKALILVVSIYFTINYVGVYAFPISQSLSVILFQSWYSGGLSYRSMNTNWWKFDRMVFIPPALLMLIIVALCLYYYTI